MEDVRRYIANLINRTESGEVDGMLAGKLGYLSNILIKIIEGGELEKRVDLLEKEINQRG
jgi:hypothetical protein